MTTNDKPVCEVTGMDEYGLILGWYGHWSDVPVGTKLYARPQPAAPQVPEVSQRWRDAVADEYLDAIEKAGDILGQADDGETLHEACARVVAERDALLAARAESPDLMAIARGAWRAAITLGNNICVQASDRENDRDGDTGWIDGTAECANRIREWVEPDDAQLIGLLDEAGVDTTALTATPPAPEQPKPAGYAVDLDLSPEQCAEWLDAKYLRHGEVEDRVCADTIRRLAAQPAQGEGEK